MSAPTALARFARSAGRALAFAALGCCALAVPPAARAEDAGRYPQQSIRWLVPYTPAGITDTVTRLVAAELEPALGQSIVVENRPGANSIIGTEVVARAEPDGYTLLTVVAAFATNETLYAGRLPFDTAGDFEPISLVGISPYIITVHESVPASDVGELIAYAEAHPGELAFGSSGVGAGAHLTTELFMQVAGVDMIHVPYKGSSPAMRALLGGEIQVLFDTPSTMLPQVRAGGALALGITARERLPGAPEVPTIAESGGPEIEAATWVMFLAPKGTPEAIVNRIQTETARALESDGLRARLRELGVEPAGRSPEQTRSFLTEEIAKWAEVIRTAEVELEF